MKFLFYFFTFSFVNICFPQNKTSLYLYDFPKGYKIFLYKRELGESKIVDSFRAQTRIVKRTLNDDRLYSYYLKIDEYPRVMIPFVNELPNVKIYYKHINKTDKAAYPENYVIHGGVENEKYSALTKVDNYWSNTLVRIFDSRDSLDPIKDSLLHKKYEDSVYYYNAKRDEALCSFIKQNLSAFASLDFYSREANRLPYIPKLVKLYRYLSPKLRNTPEGVRVDHILFPRIKIGDSFIDICQRDTTGEIRSLKQVATKIILLDFWASWCGPCKKKFEQLKPLYEKYKNKGFEIFAVSIDDNEKAWRKAIAVGHYKWINVSEVKGQNTKPVYDYGVYKYPTSFLIKEGKIHARDIEMDDLEKVLRKEL